MVSSGHDSAIRMGLAGWAVVAHAFNPSTWEAEEGGFLSSRPAWSTEFQGGQSYKEKPCLKTNKKDRK